MPRSSLAGFAALCLLAAACQPQAETPAPGTETASASTVAVDPTGSSVAHVEGIEWFEGGVDAAFESAAQQAKLVFLYWGAEWCPPCYDLKAHVFPRPDFQRSLRQFVPVYLDGDAPGAQRIAEQFRVQGYPSVVVLDAQRTEVARISGGADLASYAEVLDLALEDAQPVATVLAGLRTDPAQRLDAAACRRLAWNDWLDSSADDAATLAGLQLAAQRCPADSRAERDRLQVQAADLAASAARESIEAGGKPDAALETLLKSVDEVLADPQRRLDAGNALLYLGEDFFVVVRYAGAPRSARIRTHYLALLDALETDTRQSDTVRLLSAARRVMAARELDGGSIAPDIAARSRATLEEFLGRDYDANARAGIVNSASWVLIELGDDERLRAILEAQMKVARTPYYYMPDMADIEERAGKTEQALQWLERGYRESRGPATRFQWGTGYVSGLLRMAPADEPRIRAATLEVINELAGPDRIHARARVRLERLDQSLEEWAAKTGQRATLTAVAARWREICAALPATDPQRESCPALLGS